MESWKSIELRDHQVVTNHIRNYTNTMEERYIEAAYGKRRFERSYTDHEDGSLHRSAYFFDGERCADARWLSDRQTQVIIKDSFSSEAKSAKTERGLLSYLYLNHKPLPETLRNASNLGSRRHPGRECESFLIQDVNWTNATVDMVYMIDRETGMPLEIRCYDSAGLAAQDQPAWTWTAESFREVADGRFFPMTSILNSSYKTPDGDWVAAVSYRNEVKEIRFDQTYSASMFWPTIEPGANVWDQTTGKHWIEPGAKKVEVEPTTASTAVPIQAIPPSPGADTISGVGLWLGLAVLVVGGVLWWRRR